jgi:hypothetical protein
MNGKWTWKKQIVVVLVVLGALAACVGNPHSSPTSPSYTQAVRNSAVFEAAKVHLLHRILPEDVLVAMVAWKTSDDAARYFHAGLNTAGVDLWVTAEPELHELCAQFPADRAALTLRLQQLLGLPAEAESRVFVRIAVPRVALIRPCPDPDPAKPNCTANFPKSMDEHYKSWFAEQMVSRYRLPDGYPWTRLGYTSDWSADPPQMGASEFVIPKDAAFEVIEQVDTVSYCHGSGLSLR